MIESLKNAYHRIVPSDMRLWLYKIRNRQQYRALRSKVHPSEKGDFSLKPFDEHQCLFVHISKSAGTSVAKSLFGYLPYHYTAREYRVIYGRRTFDKYFKFAFVRNPWDRTYSAYRYLKAGGWNDEDKSWAAQNLSEITTFKQFVTDWLTERSVHRHIHFWPQHEFVCDRHDRLIIDHIAYFETLDDDFGEISARLRITADLGQHNANPGASYQDIYDGETRDIVAKVYAKDIEMFGYTFEGIKHRLIIGTDE